MPTSRVSTPWVGQRVLEVAPGLLHRRGVDRLRARTARAAWPGAASRTTAGRRAPARSRAARATCRPRPRVPARLPRACAAWAWGLRRRPGRRGRAPRSPDRRTRLPAGSPPTDTLGPSSVRSMVGSFSPTWKSEARARRRARAVGTAAAAVARATVLSEVRVASSTPPSTASTRTIAAPTVPSSAVSGWPTEAPTTPAASRRRATPASNDGPPRARWRRPTAPAVARPAPRPMRTPAGTASSSSPASSSAGSARPRIRRTPPTSSAGGRSTRAAPRRLPAAVAATRPNGPAASR